MRQIFIYVLVNPVTREARYVGRTFNVRNRFNAHLAAARAGTRTKVCFWIRGLAKAGLAPDFISVDECNESNWQEVETFWISYLKFIGAKLTNGTPGGDGITNPSPTIREAMARRMRIRNIGAKFSEERKRRIGDAHKGKTISKAHREILSRVHTGRPKTAETMARMAESRDRRTRRLQACVDSARSRGLSLQEMLSEGISLRCIAKVFGVSHQTIRSRIMKAQKCA